MPKHVHVSVVVCVYNEAGNCERLLKQLHHALQAVEYELIYVNDGSTDTTLAELRSSTYESLRIVDLQKNYGQSLALAAGIDAAQGRYIVTLDGDLQNDPADIPQLLQLAEQGEYEFVAGIRVERHDHALLRRLPSRLAGWLISRVIGMRWVDYGCGLKVIRRELAKRLSLYGELHRFLPVLAYLEGAHMIQVPVHHHPRQHGQSKYGLNRTWKVLCDVLLLAFRKKYLQKPMHLFGSWGLLSLTFGFGLIAYWLVQLRLGQTPGEHTSLTIGILLSLAGLQFIGMGLLADLHMRTYYESQGKRPYVVRRIYTAEAQVASQP